MLDALRELLAQSVQLLASALLEGLATFADLLVKVAVALADAFHALLKKTHWIPLVASGTPPRIVAHRAARTAKRCLFHQNRRTHPQK